MALSCIVSHFVAPGLCLLPYHELIYLILMQKKSPTLADEAFQAELTCGGPFEAPLFGGFLCYLALCQSPFHFIGFKKRITNPALVSTTLDETR